MDCLGYKQNEEVSMMTPTGEDVNVIIQQCLHILYSTFVTYNAFDEKYVRSRYVIKEDIVITCLVSCMCLNIENCALLDAL